MAVIVLSIYAAFVTGLFLCAYARAANACEERITEREHNSLVVKELLVEPVVSIQSSVAGEDMERYEKSRREYAERWMKEQMEKHEPLSELLDKGFGEPIRKIVEPTGCDEEEHPSSEILGDMFGRLGVSEPLKKEEK